MAGYSSYSPTSELLGKERPWEGHCLLRVPDKFDTSPFSDKDAHIEFVHTDAEGTKMIINNVTHPLRIVPLPNAIDVSTSRDKRAFFKAADIMNMALIGDAQAPARTDAEGTKKWSVQEHEEAIEMAQRLTRRKSMVFVEESEIEESVYLQRCKDAPDSIWTLERQTKGVLISRPDEGEGLTIPSKG